MGTGEGDRGGANGLGDGMKGRGEFQNQPGNQYLNPQ